MQIEEKTTLISSSDKEVQKHFLLKPYALKGREWVFMQVRDNGEEVDLERMVVPLDQVFAELEKNQLYNIIFSLKDALSFSDIAYAITISHAQRIEDNAGKLIFCDVHKNIIWQMSLMGTDKHLKFYLSEGDMLKNE